MRTPEALDDIPRDGETEPGAGAAGGEERVEDARQVLGGDAGAAIADLDRDPVSGVGWSRRQADRVPAAGRPRG